MHQYSPHHYDKGFDYGDFCLQQNISFVVDVFFSM